MRRSLAQKFRAAWGPNWGALAPVVTVAVALSLTVALDTPPWEANDEQWHVQNALKLARDEPVRITAPGAGLEAHQAPLYYQLLGRWNDLLGQPTEPIGPVAKPPGYITDFIFFHRGEDEDAHVEQVRVLRIPSVVFGALTVLLTAAVARRVSDDGWTPIVAAATVATWPRFAFLSGVVNNDNLANLLGAVLTLAIVALVTRRAAALGRRLVGAAAVGLTLGALALTKISAATLGLAAVAAAIVSCRTWRERFLAVVVVGACALAVSGWWLAENQRLYGDPLALEATREHLKDLSPALFALEGSVLHNLFVSTPAAVWETLWYTSGWNQFHWEWWHYIPFWGVTVAALGGFAFARGRVRSAPDRRLALALTALVALCALASVWVLALETTQTQARVALPGIAAAATLIAVGAERLPIPVWSRFALPAFGLIGTVIAIGRDVWGVAQ